MLTRAPLWAVNVVLLVAAVVAAVLFDVFGVLRGPSVGLVPAVAVFVIGGWYDDSVRRRRADR